jgi:hypothetical protein
MRRASLLAITLAALLVAAVVPAAGQEAQQQEKPKEATVAADPISGDWEGTVTMQSGPMPFYMTLAVDQDKVSGQIGNVEGSTGVSGTWLDGKLSLSFIYNGPMTLTGALKENQLTGSLAFGDGVVLPFSAKKKG